MPPLKRLAALAGIPLLFLIAFAGYRLIGDAAMGAGYAAKTICSGVFVSDRPLDQVLQDIPDNPMTPILRYRLP